jgi:hypothetical protein
MITSIQQYEAPNLFNHPLNDLMQSFSSLHKLLQSETNKSNSLKDITNATLTFESALKKIRKFAKVFLRNKKEVLYLFYFILFCFDVFLFWFV